MQTKEISLSPEQVDNLTAWACMLPRGFTRDAVIRKLQTMKLVVEDVEALASAAILQWKAAGKIKFYRGRWEWVFNA